MIRTRACFALSLFLGVVSFAADARPDSRRMTFCALVRGDQGFTFSHQVVWSLAIYATNSVHKPEGEHGNLTDAISQLDALSLLLVGSGAGHLLDSAQAEWFRIWIENSESLVIAALEPVPTPDAHVIIRCGTLGSALVGLSDSPSVRDGVSRRCSAPGHCVFFCDRAGDGGPPILTIVGGDEAVAQKGVRALTNFLVMENLW